MSCVSKTVRVESFRLDAVFSYVRTLVNLAPEGRWDEFWQECMCVCEFVWHGEALVHTTDVFSAISSSFLQTLSFSKTLAFSFSSVRLSSALWILADLALGLFCGNG